MIDRDDLRAAVAAGRLSEAQAADLLTLAEARRDGRAAIRPGEEPFELFRGFNEIFILVGLGVLAFGWVLACSALVTRAEDIRVATMVAALASFGLNALLSEYFIRRRRMVGPAIGLCIAWGMTAFVFWALWNDSVSVFGGLDPEASILPLALTTGTILLYWLRYRVPFGMALMAAAAFACLILALASASGREVTTETLFFLSAEGPFAWGTLLFGLAVFALAMRFDISDRHRVSLRSANGFWLHVVAAPAIVNTTALTLLERGTTGALLALGILLLLFAVVAVVIDRRSFLIAAVGYTLTLIFVATGRGDEFGTWPLFVLALGAGLVGLGAGWQSVRAALLRGVPAAWRDRLPPSARTSDPDPT